MLKNEVKITKTFVSDDKKICFVFFGNEKRENIDYEKLNQIIEQYFENLNYYDDTIRIISCIRTIFKDFDESYLEVSLSEEEKEISILYIDKLLFKYEESNKKGANIRYMIGRKIDYYDNGIEQFNHGIIDSSLNKIKYLKQLESIDDLKITCHDKILYQVYKLFYGEVPDFKIPSINIKFQMMLLILEEFGISFNYDFYKNKKNYPVSFEVTEFVNKMKLFGDIEEKDILSQENKNIVQIVGKNINEFINDQENSLETLIKLGTFLYIKRNCTYKENLLEESEYIKRINLIRDKIRRK